MRHRAWSLSYFILPLLLPAFSVADDFGATASIDYSRARQAAAAKPRPQASDQLTNTLQQSLIAAIKEMTDHPHSFANPPESRFNPRYWYPDRVNAAEHPGRFLVGAEPASKAIQDAVTHAYSFDCSVAISLTWWEAIRKTLEDPDEANPNWLFDRAFKDGSIHPAQSGHWFGPPLDSVVNQMGAETPVPFRNLNEENAFLAALQPGDWVYVVAKGANDKMKAAGWSGENMMYRGRGPNGPEFLAQGPEQGPIVTIDQIKEELIRMGMKEYGCEVTPGLVNQFLRIDPERLRAFARRAAGIP